MDTHDNDPLLVEAIARRDESRAMILQSRAQAGGTAMDRMADAFSKSAEAADKVEPVRPDPEGTARLLADSEGNFAVNAEVAATGGTGIKASNTNVDTGKPANTADEAGEAITEGAQTIIGDQPVGGDDLDTLSDEDLRARYQDVLGEKPHHAAGRATMIARIADKQG